MELTTNIQVIIDHDLEDGTHFRDAIYYSQADYAVMSPDQLKTDAQARIDGYVAATAAKTNAPAKGVMTTQEDQLRAMLDAKAAVDVSFQDIVARKADLDAAIMAIAQPAPDSIATAIAAVPKG